MKCETTGPQLSGYLDGELTQQESQRVRVHLEDCGQCRALHTDLLSLKGQVGDLSYPSGDESMLAALESDLLVRSARGLGWLFLLAGLSIIVGFGLYGFFTDPQLPTLLCVCYALVMLGALGLFAAVLRQRWLSYRHDKYRRVKL